MKKAILTVVLLLAASTIANANCYLELKEERMAMMARDSVMMQAWNSDVLWVYKKILEDQKKMVEAIKKTNQCVSLNPEWYEEEGHLVVRGRDDLSTKYMHESTTKYMEAVIRLLESKGL